VGFTASKKVGNAVKRNFAKRRLRAIFIELHDRLESGEYIFVAKKAITEEEYPKIKSSIEHALRRLGAIR
jgi:ribonuclease P protein component